jgi:hypothetical protein
MATTCRSRSLAGREGGRSRRAERSGRMADDETGRALQGRKVIDLIDMINEDELEDWTKKFEERLAQAEGRAGHPAAVTDVDAEQQTRCAPHDMN